MFRKMLFTLILLFILIIVGCSKNKVTVTEQLEHYTSLWIEQQFNEMYELLTEETKQQYPTSEFIDRYKKIYKDIEVSDLSISYDELSKEEIKEANKNKKIDIPLKVSLNSIAGEIDFSYNITFVQVEEDKQLNWKVSWDPGLIFPDLVDGGQIQISTTEPKRGEILDRNRMPLAINDVVYEFGIVPERFVNEKDEIQQAANLLGISVSSIEQSLNADWVQPDLFVPLRKVSKNKDNLITQLNAIPAVTYRKVSGRTYPSGKAAAHLTGYIGQITDEELKEVDKSKYTPHDDIGKRGLEQLFEEKLKGENGFTITIKKEDEEITLAEKQVKDGENIIVTIDINVQEAIYNEFGTYAGTAAAIHPKTGEVLALVSSPAFNPNDLLYGISEKDWDQLQNNPQKPLINRFSSTFAPGSVIKPVTAAIGLKNGTIKPNDALTINGLTWGKKNWGNYKIRRVSDSGKPVDLKDALNRSDNIYFAMQAVKMGEKSFTNGLEQFGFTEKIPFQYPISQSSISNDGTLKDEVLLANTSYGQGEIEVTPLHMALMYTPFLNKGNLIKPTLLLEDKTGQIWQKDLLDEDDAELMKDILRSVVTNGTAKIANVDELKISGKTGTAELKLTSNSKGSENGWFVGYPTDTEDILIAMMMEKVEHSGASSFVAKKVTDILIDYKK